MANVEAVKYVQSFGADKQVQGGITYVKVQFPDRQGTNIGWVDARQVQVQSECAYALPAHGVPAQLAAQASELLTSSDCCTFPVTIRPTVDYKTGIRAFWGRGSRRRSSARGLRPLS